MDEVIERYKTLQDFPGELPVFPLKGAILLPRVTMPLNIFEPRYLAMVDHALATGRLIGIVQPRTLDDDVESPAGKLVPLRNFGAAGRISSFQETDDGRYLITLTGIARFRLVSELPTDQNFRIWTADFSGFLEDLKPGLGEDDVDRPQLLRVLRAYLDANELRADWQAINHSSNEFLVNTLSMISPYGPEEKQALLEASDLRRRAEVLIALAEMELASRDDGSGSALQ